MLFIYFLLAFASGESKREVPALARKMLSQQNVIGDLATLNAEMYPYVSLQSVWESCEHAGNLNVALVSWEVIQKIFNKLRKLQSK
jgi:hypothetical protein